MGLVALHAVITFVPTPLDLLQCLEGFSLVKEWQGRGRAGDIAMAGALDFGEDKP